MAIKRVFNVIDENYGEIHELSGQHGYFNHINIHMIDTFAMAQDCIRMLQKKKMILSIK